MLCPKCGADNPDVARFCGSCSAAIAVQAGPVLSVPGAAPAVSAGLKWGIAALTVLIPLLGLIMGIIYMKDPNPEKKAAGKMWLVVACVIIALYCVVSMASLNV
jgi:hypothetical protein